MIRNKQMGKRRGGFTIIELLIVVIVIGVLASAGMAKYQGFQETARSKTCMSNQVTIENSIGIWCTQNTALNDTVWYADGFDRNGHCGAWWSGSPPWGATYAIASVIRDNKAWVCPNVLQRYGSLQNVPGGYYGVQCWVGQYVFYAINPSVGEPWNGWLVNYPGGTGAQANLQLVCCPAFGMASCPHPAGAQYKHSSRWN